jgi:DNA-binding MarR family transcriptional regulator
VVCCLDVCVTMTSAQVPSEQPLKHGSSAVEAQDNFHLFGRLFDLMHMYQRKNGYVFSAWGELSLLEHQLLIELDQKIPRRPSDLALRVNFPIAQLVRTLDSLRRRKFVRFVPGDTKRDKLVFITLEGRKVVLKLDDISNHLMNLLAEAGTKKQQQEMYDLWEMLNNAIGAPRTVARPGDHPLRLQARRYTRAFSYFGRRCGTTDLGYPDLQILFCVVEDDSGATLDALSRKLLVPRTTLKARVRKLYERGLCTEPSEKKGVLVRATPLTLPAVAEARAGYAQFLGATLKSEVVKQIEPMLDACASMILNWKPDYSWLHKHEQALPKETIFLPLQVQVLSEFTRQQFGILQPSVPVDLPPGTFILVLFEGPTPCFSLRLKQCNSGGSYPQSLLVEEFGHSERVDWECVSQRVAEGLQWGAGAIVPEGTFLRGSMRKCLLPRSAMAPINSLPVQIDQRAEPLRHLIDLPAEV